MAAGFNVVSSMSQLLRKSIFGIPHLGTINIHPAKLPAYRGPNPTLWMYHDMEMNPGVTVHYIDEGEDTGDIIEQETFPMTLGMSMEERLEREHTLGLELLARAIEKLKNGNVKTIKQPADSSTLRARNITYEEAPSFIPWNEWSVERVWHFLRGEGNYYPFIPQPQGGYKGQVWTFVSYGKMRESNKAGTLYKEKGKCFLACKDGRIELKVIFSIRNMLKTWIKKLTGQI